MTLHEAYNDLQRNLQKVYDDREAANIADLIMEGATGHRKIGRIIHKHSAITNDQIVALQNYTFELLNHRPVQYVLHEAWFAGLKLYVDESVLIPRRETEELVEWIIQEVGNKKYEVQIDEANAKVKIQNSKITILDVGTGSGCIPLTLKDKLPWAEVSAIDVSPDALKVAMKNADSHQLEVNFQQIDFLNTSQWNVLSEYDIIVSNPPYIKQSEEAAMNKNVLDHEPHLALFVPDEDALIFYKALAEFAQSHLKSGGKLFVEINEALGKKVVDIFEQHNFKNIELRKDMQGKERMVKAES